MSVEPISGDLENITVATDWADWIIVGAETGSRKGKITPKRAWIEKIVKAATDNNVPVLLKDSEELRAVWGNDLIQQFPKGLEPMPEDNSVPHCKECRDAQVVRQDKRGDTVTCTATDRRVPSRYARSSPAWCPKRTK